MRTLLFTLLLLVGINSQGNTTLENNNNDIELFCSIELVNNGASTVSVRIVATKNGETWTAYAAGVKGGKTVSVDMGNDYMATYNVYTKGPYDSSYTKHYSSGCGTYYI